MKMVTRIDEARITTRVLLADDHDLVRAGIRALIEQIATVRVVAEASDGWETLRLIAKHQPDLVLLDIIMPRLNGFEVLDHVKKEFPEVRVIILSAHETEEYVVHALRAGAAGYLTKHAACSELSLAIKTVMNGETFLSPRFSVRTFLEHARDRGPGPYSRWALTPRQHEVLRMIAESHTTKHIALKLDISVKTVESHRAQLMERLNIHDVAGLVRYAIKTGLVKIDDHDSLRLAITR
jgi:DNA-binding NarL/FixJ family response regulator